MKRLLRRRFGASPQRLTDVFTYHPDIRRMFDFTANIEQSEFDRFMLNLEEVTSKWISLGSPEVHSTSS